MMEAVMGMLAPFFGALSWWKWALLAVAVLNALPSEWRGFGKLWTNFRTGLRDFKSRMKFLWRALWDPQIPFRGTLFSLKAVIIQAVDLVLTFAVDVISIVWPLYYTYRDWRKKNGGPA